MDATRAQDGKPVMLKCLMTKRAVTELEIGFFFSDPKRKDDPQNHCVPILDVLHSPFDKKAPIIVMPRLYPCHYPGFDSVGEAIDFFRQTFEVVHGCIVCLSASVSNIWIRASNTCTGITLLTSRSLDLLQIFRYSMSFGGSETSQS